MTAAAAVAGFCMGKLPSSNWSVGTGSPPAGTNREMCSAWGGAKWQPLNGAIASHRVCAFSETPAAPSSAQQLTRACSAWHLRRVIHFIPWNSNKNITFSLNYPRGAKLLSDTDFSIILQVTSCMAQSRNTVLSLHFVQIQKSPWLAEKRRIRLPVNMPVYIFVS